MKFRNLFVKPVFFENGIFQKRQKINYRNVPIYTVVVH